MSKRLVAFFSASGNTKKIAQTLAEAAGADLYEITPRVAYTSADLNWMDKKSRSSVEMKDKKIRPELGGESLDIDPYDEIVLGFPIWWYVAPTIINTFLEAHDFTGKTIRTVCYLWRQRFRQHGERTGAIGTGSHFYRKARY